MQPLTALWRRLTPGQRLGFATGLGFIIITAILATIWAKSPEYTVLYSGLEPRDAGQVVDALRSKKVPYRVSGGGTAVEVPSSKVHEIRIDLATAGLPHTGGTGWELLDKNQLGMTDFLQNLNYQRALEGELARTVSTLSEVQSARVHLVMPRAALFAEDQKEPTASVVLKMRGSSRLGAAQVRGITHLVAGSVEGLSPRNITVLDTDGRTLTLPQSEASLAGLSSEQLDIQRGVESYLSGKAQGMLAGVVGDGKVMVQVAADLDFEKVEKTVETYDSDNPVVRSEQRTTSPSGGGAVGESSTTNYEIGKTVSHVQDGVGAIKKLTVAVLVDGVTTVDDKGKAVYQPRTPEELSKLTAVVKNAVGFDPARGDQVEVANVPFETGPDPAELHRMKKEEQTRFFMDMAGKVGTALLLIVVFFFARTMFKRATSLGGAGNAGALPAPMGPGGRILPMPGGGSPEDLTNEELERRVLLLAQEDPENMARLLKGWLRDTSEEAQA